MTQFARNTQKHLGWLALGLERAARTTIRWAKEPSDKQKVRRRAAIIFGAPAGFMLAASEYPGVAISGSFLILIGVGGWFGYTERNEMQVHEIETSAPYEVSGVPLTGREIFERFLAAHAGEDLTTLAAHLGNDIGPEELERQMRMWGVRPPLRIVPSPTTEEVPVEPEVVGGSPAETPATEKVAESGGEDNPVQRTSPLDRDDVGFSHERRREVESAQPDDLGVVPAVRGPSDRPSRRGEGSVRRGEVLQLAVEQG